MKKFLSVAFISIVAVCGLEGTIFFKMEADRLLYQRKVLLKSVSSLNSQIDELNAKIRRLENKDEDFGGKLEQMEFETFAIFNAAK